MTTGCLCLASMLIAPVILGQHVNYVAVCQELGSPDARITGNAGTPIPVVLIVQDATRRSEIDSSFTHGLNVTVVDPSVTVLPNPVPVRRGIGFCRFESAVPANTTFTVAESNLAESYEGQVLIADPGRAVRFGVYAPHRAVARSPLAVLIRAEDSAGAVDRSFGGDVVIRFGGNHPVLYTASFGVLRVAVGEQYDGTTSIAVGQGSIPVTLRDGQRSVEVTGGLPEDATRIVLAEETPICAAGRERPICFQAVGPAGLPAPSYTVTCYYTITEEHPNGSVVLPMGILAFEDGCAFVPVLDTEVEALSIAVYADDLDGCAAGFAVVEPDRAVSLGLTPDGTSLDHAYVDTGWDARFALYALTADLWPTTNYAGAVNLSFSERNPDGSVTAGSSATLTNGLAFLSFRDGEEEYVGVEIEDTTGLLVERPGTIYVSDPWLPSFEISRVAPSTNRVYVGFSRSLDPATVVVTNFEIRTNRQGTGANWVLGAGLSAISDVVVLTTANQLARTNWLVARNGIRDGDGNSFAGSTNVFIGVADDTEGPVLLTVEGYYDSGEYVLTFDEPLSIDRPVRSSNVLLLRGAVEVTQAQAAYTWQPGNEILAVLSAPYGTNYRVVARGIADLAGNVSTSTQPGTLRITPPNGMESVEAIDPTHVRVVFTTVLDPATITPAKFTVALESDTNERLTVRNVTTEEIVAFPDWGPPHPATRCVLEIEPTTEYEYYFITASVTIQDDEGWGLSSAPESHVRQIFWSARAFELYWASATSPYHIRLDFSEYVDPVSGAALSNYSVQGGSLQIRGAIVSGYSVYLTTSRQVTGMAYSVRVKSGVRSALGAVLGTDAIESVTGAADYYEPELVGVERVSPRKLEIRFNEAMRAPTGNASNYFHCSNLAMVSLERKEEDQTILLLTTADQTNGREYEIVLDTEKGGVADLVGNSIQLDREFEAELTTSDFPYAGPGWIRLEVNGVTNMVNFTNLPDPWELDYRISEAFGNTWPAWTSTSGGGVFVSLRGRRFSLVAHSSNPDVTLEFFGVSPPQVYSGIPFTIVGQDSDTTPPAAPTNLSVTNAPGRVVLSWEVRSGAEVPDRFRVYRALTNFGTNRPGAPVTATAEGSGGFLRNAVDYAPEPGRTNYYAVSALDSSGNESALSAVVGFSVPNFPGPVTNLVVTVSTDRSVLSWEPPTTGGPPLHYLVYRSSTSFSGPLVYPYLATPEGTAPFLTVVTDTNVTGGQHWYYGVCGEGAGGIGVIALSGRVAVPERPGAPGWVAITTDCLSVGLLWGVPRDRGVPDRYRVYRWDAPFSAPPGPALVETPVGSGTTVTNCVDGGVSLGNTYYYGVEAVNVWGAGALSEVLAVRIPAFFRGTNFDSELVTVVLPDGAFTEPYRLVVDTNPSGDDIDAANTAPAGGIRLPEGTADSVTGLRIVDPSDLDRDIPLPAGHPATITLRYRRSDVPAFDRKGMKVLRLGSPWRVEADSQHALVGDYGVVTAQVDTLGVFRLGAFSAAAADLSAATLHPNPLFLAEGSRVAFTRLPRSVRVRIYNLHGELVTELEKDDEGEDLLWDFTAENETLATGIYYAVLEQVGGGGEPRTIKIGIVK